MGVIEISFILQGIPAPKNERGVSYLIFKIISAERISGSAENYLDLVCLAVACNRDNGSVNCNTINCKRLNALVDVVRVLDFDLVNIAAELTCSLEAAPCRRDGRIDGKTVELRLNAKDVLGDGYHVPSSSTSEPGVLALTEVLGILTADHLTVNVRLCLVDIGCLFGECRSDLRIVLESLVSSSRISLGADDPRVVVCEDTRVLLVSARIC